MSITTLLLLPPKSQYLIALRQIADVTLKFSTQVPSCR
jgi:hypothetical protein